VVDDECDMAGEFKPLEAAIGGLFVGVASGVSMMYAARVASNSGALRTVLNGDGRSDNWRLGYVAGLVLAGGGVARLLPNLIEAAPSVGSVSAIGSLLLGGMAVGAGTTWANGCTSGHGLCGLSRVSLRSLVAVPTFMATAVAFRTLGTGLAGIGMLPLVATSSEVKLAAAQLAAAFAVALALLHKLAPVVETGELRCGWRATLYGLWCGGCFGVGLCVGGMARPSAVLGALSPTNFDATLWVLFATGLVTTFALYRLAELRGVAAASVASAPHGVVSRELVVGSVLFGVGWALTGLCPGPIAVGLGAHPTSPGQLLCLAGFAIGARGAGGAPLLRLRAKGL